MTDPKSRAWKEIGLDALAHNARTLQRRLAPGCDLMAVVKADAYGHGAVPVAKRLEQEGVTAFAAACLEEGIALRQSRVKGLILILGALKIANMWLAVFADVGVAVIAILNAMRALRL